MAPFHSLHVLLALVLVAVANGATVFEADCSAPSLTAAFGGAKVRYGGQNVKLWANGTGLNVTYPAGSYVPSQTPVGGFGLYTDTPVPQGTAILSYSVYFPKGFNFVKGGKLPGLYGGKTSCTGGDPAEDCFSTRLMWRAGGAGEVYLYANREAQDPAICSTPNNECNPTYGWSLNRGSFKFATGKWTNVVETVRMNTAGKRDGLLKLSVNGVEVLTYSNIVFRTADYPQTIVSGIDVETFFGGNSKDYASPTEQKASFKDFVLSSN